jgi:hypothetical protein
VSTAKRRERRVAARCLRTSADAEMRVGDDRFRRDLVFALMRADQRFLRCSGVIGRLHRALLAPVRPTNGCTVEAPVAGSLRQALR